MIEADNDNRVMVEFGMRPVVMKVPLALIRQWLGERVEGWVMTISCVLNFIFLFGLIAVAIIMLLS